MEIRRVPMTVREYELLPFHPGWKVELFDGEARFQPREALAFGTLVVGPRKLRPIATVRPAEPQDAPELLAAFRAAFADSVEYCGWPAADFQRESGKVIEDFFTSRRGEPLPASSVAIAGPGGPDDGAVIGAALVANRGEAAKLDLLFVVPDWQRRGVATQLGGTVINALADAGRNLLISGWHLGSDASAAWHQRMGFVEEPDLFNAKLYLRRASQELWRLEQLGELEDSRHADLLAEVSRWQAEAKRLEKLLDEEGKDAAFAVFRYG
jgi:GNAT superfamily N-acetyltransferase